jgi:hypothetical protein
MAWSEHMDDGFPGSGAGDGASECSADGFPAVGESDGDMADEAVSFPSAVNDNEWVAMQGESGDDADMWQPSVATPRASLPIHSEDSPVSTGVPTSESSSVSSPAQSTKRIRLRKKTKTGCAGAFEFFDEKRKVNLRHELLTA